MESAIKKFSLLSDKQIGFIGGFRTSDHILVINSIVDQIVKVKRKQLFVAFVDLRKAYDRVHRKAVFYKLKKLGINGIFLDSLQAMYNKVEMTGKIKNRILPPVTTSLGLKQGDNLSPLLFDLFFDDVDTIFDSECDPIHILPNSSPLNHLLFADDMALMSLSRTGLQLCLNKFEEYCTQWGLEVNLSKTKTMIFNRSGKIPKNIVFTFSGKPIEMVNKFKYLGTILSASGSVRAAQESLLSSGRKAYFSSQKMLFKFDFDPNLSIELFSKLIVPIITYNSEIWSIISDKNITKLSNGKIELEKLYLNAPIEKLQMHCLRNILGLSNKCTRIAVLGEMGCYPVLLQCFVQMIKYWHRLETTSEDNTLVKQAFLGSKSTFLEGHHNWLSSVKIILTHCGLSEVSINPSKYKPKKLASICKKKLHMKFQNYWKRALSQPSLYNHNCVDDNRNKLKTFKSFKFIFKREKYIEVIKNREVRKALAKLRCSNHRLKIEEGRFMSIPQENRICPNPSGNGDVEDEIHFLLSCGIYTEIRKKFLNFVIDKSQNVKLLDKANLFNWLMITEDTQILSELGKFVHSCFKVRSKFIENEENMT